MSDLLTTRQDEIYVISLWQPWAQWVMWGWKTIETRRHDRFKNLVGQTIGIHAAKKWDKDALRLAVWLTPDQIRKTAMLLPSVKHKPGRLLGTVDVIACRWLNESYSEFALIECVTKRSGLMLRNPNLLQTPIPMRGQQGMWKYKLP